MIYTTSRSRLCRRKDSLLSTLRAGPTGIMSLCHACSALQKPAMRTLCSRLRPSSRSVLSRLRSAKAASGTVVRVSICTGSTFGAQAYRTTSSASSPRPTRSKTPRSGASPCIATTCARTAALSTRHNTHPSTSCPPRAPNLPTRSSQPTSGARTKCGAIRNRCC